MTSNIYKWVSEIFTSSKTTQISPQVIKHSVSLLQKKEKLTIINESSETIHPKQFIGLDDKDYSYLFEAASKSDELTILNSLKDCFEYCQNNLKKQNLGHIERINFLLLSGYSHFISQDFETAFKNYEDALNISKVFIYKEKLCEIYFRLAQILKKLEKQNEAILYLETALQELSIQNFWKAQIYIELASIYISRCQFVKAEKLLFEAKTICGNIKNESISTNMTRNLAYLRESEGKWSLALDIHKKLLEQHSISGNELEKHKDMLEIAKIQKNQERKTLK